MLDPETSPGIGQYGLDFWFVRLFTQRRSKET
jgi:hypothetical protein